MRSDTEVYRRNYDGGASTRYDTVLSVRTWPSHGNKLIRLRTDGEEQIVLVEEQDREQFLADLRAALFPEEQPQTEEVDTRLAAGRTLPSGDTIHATGSRPFGSGPWYYVEGGATVYSATVTVLDEEGPADV